MGYYVGLDVSLKETSICVVDDAGEVVFLVFGIPCVLRVGGSGGPARG